MPYKTTQVKKQEFLDSEDESQKELVTEEGEVSAYLKLAAAEHGGKAGVGSVRDIDTPPPRKGFRLKR